MWFLFLMMVLNAALHNKGFVLEFRYNVAGIPVNLLDALLFLGVIGVLLGTGLGMRRHPTDRIHPVMIASLIAFAIALAVGAVMGALNGATGGTALYSYIAEIRNTSALPLSMACGYYFLKFPPSSLRFIYVHVIAGIASATLILLFFVGKTSALTTGQVVDSVRAIEYVSWYAGLAGALLLYTLFHAESRVLPLLITAPVMGYCFVGQFATLSRSDWVAAAAAIGVIPFILPGKRAMARASFFVVGIPATIGAVVLGLVILSNLTNRDLIEPLARRVKSVLPSERGDDSYGRAKAWDTRLPGLAREFELWTESPLFGHGFAYTSSKNLIVDDTAFYHNVWIAQSAVMGIFGFAAYAIPVFGMIVVGRRMTREAIDKGTLLVGVVGVTTGVYAILIGIATMSFNMQRGALCIGLMAGVVLRARAMQLEVAREYHDYIDWEARAAAEARGELPFLIDAAGEPTTATGAHDPRAAQTY